MGQGPMTGRALGYCAGTPAPGYSAGGWGRGGRGRGRGRGAWGGRGRGGWGPGWGGGWAPAPPVGPVPYALAPAVSELQALRQQARAMEQTLEQITKRIQELEAADPEGEKQ